MTPPPPPPHFTPLAMAISYQIPQLTFIQYYPMFLIQVVHYCEHIYAYKYKSIIIHKINYHILFYCLQKIAKKQRRFYFLRSLQGILIFYDNLQTATYN